MRSAVDENLKRGPLLLKSSNVPLFAVGDLGCGACGLRGPRQCLSARGDARLCIERFSGQRHAGHACERQGISGTMGRTNPHTQQSCRTRVQADRARTRLQTDEGNESPPATERLILYNYSIGKTLCCVFFTAVVFSCTHGSNVFRLPPMSCSPLGRGRPDASLSAP